MSLSGSLSIYSYSRLSAAGLKCGFSADEVLSAAGIEFDMQRKVGYDLSLENIVNLYAAASRSSTRGYFPLAMAEHFSFDFLPEVEAFLSTSPTLESAAKVIDWLPALLVPEFRFTVTSKNSEVAFEINIEGADPTNIAVQGIVETVVACAVLFLKKLLPLEANFVVCLKHKASTELQHYLDTFGQIPLFERSFDGLLIPQTELFRPIAKDAGRVNAMTALAIENTIRSKENSRSIVDVVAKRLIRKPESSVDEIAAQLDMPVRTLQRRLKDEESSFHTLQNEAMSKLAKHYLSNPQLDMEAIALKLGFSDRHSFTRAFKRWTGITPSAWRQKGSAI